MKAEKNYFAETQSPQRKANRIFQVNTETGRV
jgi:hypothetical protein